MDSTVTLRKSLTMFQAAFLGLAWMTPMIYFSVFGIAYDASQGSITEANTPNPLDPAAAYPSVPVQVDVMPVVPLDADDPCVSLRPENERSFDNTRSCRQLLGI